MEPHAIAEHPADAIDRFAEELLRHPERACDLKAALRHAIGHGRRRDAGADTGRDVEDVDDLWDNVPV